MTFASLSATLMHFDTITKNGPYWVKMYLQGGHVLMGAIHNPGDYTVRLDVKGEPNEATFISIADIVAISLNND